MKRVCYFVGMIRQWQQHIQNYVKLLRWSVLETLHLRCLQGSEYASEWQYNTLRSLMYQFFCDGTIPHFYAVHLLLTLFQSLCVSWLCSVRDFIFGFHQKQCFSDQNNFIFTSLLICSANTSFKDKMLLLTLSRDRSIDREGLIARSLLRRLWLRSKSSVEQPISVYKM